MEKNCISSTGVNLLVDGEKFDIFDGGYMFFDGKNLHIFDGGNVLLDGENFYIFDGENGYSDAGIYVFGNGGEIFFCSGVGSRRGDNGIIVESFVGGNGAGSFSSCRKIWGGAVNIFAAGPEICLTGKFWSGGHVFGGECYRFSGGKFDVVQVRRNLGREVVSVDIYSVSVGIEFGDVRFFGRRMDFVICGGDDGIIGIRKSSIGGKVGAEVIWCGAGN